MHARKGAMNLLKGIILLTVLVTNFELSFGEKNFSYRAAGVLPYALGADGKVKFLLGVSSVHHNQVTDYGGLRDEIDKHHPKWTAAREGCEELMFLFDDNCAFEKIVALRNKQGKRFDAFKAGSQSYNQLFSSMSNAHFSVSDNYIMYFITLRFDESIPEVFRQRKSCYEGSLPDCWDETVKLIWVDADELFDVIDNKRILRIQNFNLYEPFVKSLVMARKQGIIAEIKKSTELFKR